MATPPGHLRRFVAPALFALAVLPALTRAQATPTGQPGTPAPQPPAPSTPSVTVPAQRTAAQDAAAAMGRQVTNQEIADAIRRSGMSEAQVRARLQQAGYDPKLADPFFSGGDPASAASGMNAEAASAMLAALQTNDEQTEPDESTASNTPRFAASSTSRVFGKSVFSSRSSAFDPVALGPVDPSYRLGVGDQVQLIITGEVEQAYSLDIRRDGTVVVPQVGQVMIAGLSLDGARSLLKQRASRAYAGIAEGTAQLDLTVSRVRSNAVFVVGEIENPGGYQVSALGTVFHAIAKAGGPTERGSFREIEVRRGGNVVKRIDLYDYLLNGDARNDIRTEQGDVIFVPLNTRAVGVIGMVRRPGLFELRREEGFADLLRFAGGLLPTAATNRVQIDRVLPPEQREPGKDRVVLDVKLNGRMDVLDSIRLLDNDIVTVYPIGNLRRNRVVVQGEVFQPGTYEWHEGMTLRSVLEEAQGTLPWALVDRVKVTRPLVESGRSELFSLNLRDSAEANFRISEFDQVEVLDGRLAFPAGTVQIAGAVNRPGTRPYVERQTLKDLVDAAGGFREEAQFVEVARRRRGASYSDTTAVIHRFVIDSAFGRSGGSERFVMERGDVVTVRESPGFRDARVVTVQGLFTYPGTYVLRSDGERISALLRRVGGPLPTAYGESFRLIRGGRPVAVDFAKALRGDPLHDVLLTGGDQLRIGPNPSVVYVTGAVERQVVVPFNPGWSLSQYIDAAGGRTEAAAKHKAVVEFASGRIQRVDRRWYRPAEDPRLEAGATVTIPSRPARTGSFTQSVTTAVQVTSAVLSLVIGYLAVTR